MPSHQSIARSLAAAFVAGNFDVDEMVARGTVLLGRSWKWLKPLARRIVEAYPQTRPRRITLEKFLLADPGFLSALEKHEWEMPEYELQFSGEVGSSASMSPIFAARDWNARPIHNSAELADWLGLSLGELDWFADCKRLIYKKNRPKLSHYRYRTLTKKFGSARLIESPKPRLKAIQQQILQEILEAVPPHPAAHGFRRGRSIVSFSEPHVGKQVVIKLDLQDFFPTIPLAQVQALFRTIGYPERVADLLAGLCTNSAPVNVWNLDRSSSLDDPVLPPIRIYSKPHLPQGAPTSPALANLCAYRLDCRLSGLAESVDANYTRYADDLAFSGESDLQRAAKRFAIYASSIAMEEGFSVHHRKTRIMRQGVRQRIAGVVVNRRINASRSDFDRLKATLTNCVRFGAESQNRDSIENFDSHLAGLISFFAMLNPEKAERLQKLWEQIEWSNKPE